MLLYHYTEVRNVETIKQFGLRSGGLNPDTDVINKVLMASTHPFKINRENCVFLLSEAPEVKEGYTLFVVDSDNLDHTKLYTAEFYSADAIWVNLKSPKPDQREIKKHARNYWDSLSSFSEDDFFDEEIELEILYLGTIPAADARQNHQSSQSSNHFRRNQSMESINFNKLAWESPKHGDKYGYIPTDEMYDAIVEWLKTGNKLWETKAGDIVTTRINFVGSLYDAVVEYDTKIKMISWTFRLIGEFHA